jgi:hypothetical protein
MLLKCLVIDNAIPTIRLSIYNLYDSNNRAVWFSRIDGQPLFLGGVRTRNEQLLLRLFDILLNSSEGIEFNKNAKMIITFVTCPFEAGIQLPEGLLDRNRLRKEEFLLFLNNAWKKNVQSVFSVSRTKKIISPQALCETTINKNSRSQDQQVSERPQT